MTTKYYLRRVQGNPLFCVFGGMYPTISFMVTTPPDNSDYNYHFSYVIYLQDPIYSINRRNGSLIYPNSTSFRDLSTSILMFSSPHQVQLSELTLKFTGGYLHLSSYYRFERIHEVQFDTMSNASEKEGKVNEQSCEE